MSVVVARDIVAIEGADAASYLHGQLSQAVTDLAVGDSRWSFVLEPSGKLGFLVRVRRAGESRYELDVEAGQGDALEARLRRFFLRVKAEFSRSSALVDVDPEPSGDGTALVGWSPERTHRTTEAPASSSEAVDAARVAAGWPGPPELDEGRIPGETTLVPLAASFTKGCYTGQELVARVDSRGNNVPHLLHRIVLTGPAHVGDEVVVDGTTAGTLTTVADRVALAYLARRIEAPCAAMVAGSTATIEQLR